ncbi:hypothetical protein LJC60_00565 [Ruminococcaceae bacterium OttesenSCG-928-D13]|nr:hypothetical protein [Ruminococcaceae bacterium OttesenSCG-928-D13]
MNTKLKKIEEYYEKINSGKSTPVAPRKLNEDDAPFFMLTYMDLQMLYNASVRKLGKRKVKQNMYSFDEFEKHNAVCKDAVCKKDVFFSMDKEFGSVVMSIPVAHTGKVHIRNLKKAIEVECNILTSVYHHFMSISRIMFRDGILFVEAYFYNHEDTGRYFRGHTLDEYRTFVKQDESALKSTYYEVEILGGCRTAGWAFMGLFTNSDNIFPEDEDVVEEMAYIMEGCEDFSYYENLIFSTESPMQTDYYGKIMLDGKKMIDMVGIVKTKEMADMLQETAAEKKMNITFYTSIPPLEKLKNPGFFVFSFGKSEEAWGRSIVQKIESAMPSANVRWQNVIEDGEN